MSRHSQILPDEPHDHDHGACVSRALADARAEAERARAKLDGHRLLVLNALLASHQPQSAYDVIEAVAVAGPRLRPAQAYRALDALGDLGLVHRVETRNAFIACLGGTACRAPQLLICTGCGRVTEVNDEGLAALLGVAARREGFRMERARVEVTGRCGTCASAAPSSED